MAKKYRNAFAHWFQWWTRIDQERTQRHNSFQSHSQNIPILLAHKICRILLFFVCCTIRKIAAAPQVSISTGPLEKQISAKVYIYGTHILKAASLTSPPLVLITQISKTTFASLQCDHMISKHKITSGIIMYHLLDVIFLLWLCKTNFVESRESPWP